MAADPLDTLVAREHALESTRRTFLKQAAGLSATCMVGLDDQTNAQTARLSAAPSSPGTASWYDRPMRWAQLSFVEDDPGNYDMQFWLDYFQRMLPDDFFAHRARGEPATKVSNGSRPFYVKMLITSVLPGC